MGTAIDSLTKSNDKPIEFSQGNGFETLKTEDFVQLLIAQLSNQNPLEPLENNQLLQQISSIQSLSSTSQLIDTLGGFGLNQSLGAASNLIGREVTAKIGNSSVSGVVKKAVVEDGKVFLLVGDKETKVPFDSISTVGNSPSNLDASTLASLLGDGAEDENPTSQGSPG